MSQKFMDIIPSKKAVSGKTVGDAVDANAEFSAKADINSADYSPKLDEMENASGDFTKTSEQTLEKSSDVEDSAKSDKTFDETVDDIQNFLPFPSVVDNAIDDIQAAVGIFAKIRAKLAPILSKIKNHKLATFLSVIFVILAIGVGIWFFATQTETGKNAVSASEQFLKDHGIAITNKSTMEAQKNFEKNVIDKGGRGAVYSVPFDSYNNFRAAVIGKSFDIDGAYGAQCWDGIALLYQQVGRNFSTGGTGAAKGTYINANWGGDFRPVPLSEAKRGDIIVFSIGTYGHVAFLDGNWGARINILGQNQTGDGSGSPFSVVTMSSASAIGAIRFAPWDETSPETPQNVQTATPDENPTSVTVVKGDTLGQILLDEHVATSLRGLFGDEGLAQEIATLNHMKDRGLIYPGQVIVFTKGGN